MNYNAPHTPVLLKEVVEGFKGVRDGVFIDCTLGYAGHSFKILEKYPHLQLIGIDRDDEALKFSAKRLEPFANRVKLLKGSFSKQLKEVDFSSVSALLADFGVSSLQLDKKERGFSFESPTLDMRMDQNSNFSAYDLINTYSQEMLEQIFREYGEAKEPKRVAKAIVEARKKRAIASSKELSQLIAKHTKTKSKIHPATLYFQAIRIEVNRELEEIIELLNILEEKQPKGAIIALITFHSLEDRLVKQRFRKWAKRCICPANSIRCSCGNNNNLGIELNRKPIVASKEEVSNNLRSRSAKLRLFRFND